jgi:uncharacterized protein DUF4168
MRSNLGSCVVTLAAVVALSAATTGTQAQTPTAPPDKATPKSATPAPISEKKLDATAAAVKSVSAIRQSYEDKLAKATGAEKGRLVDEATNAMTKAVTDQGLSVDEYTSIIEVAQNDPEVRSKLLQRMR